jgi:hypothetical protein
MPRKQVGKPLPARADLFRSIATSNPFDLDRISSPDDLLVDVPSIHGNHYRRLRRYVEVTAKDPRSRGVLIVGPPGVGKSHLLARLHTWARRENTVVSVPLHNLQASPERMARYLLKASVSSLFYRRGKFGGTALLELLMRAFGDEADVSAEADEGLVDREVLTVLRGFLHADGDPEPSEAALAWLSGDAIDESHARQLGELGSGNVSTVLADGAAIERVFVVLAKLMRRAGKVIVLGLDQIDNLEPDQVRSLAAFVHALIDHAPNMLVLASGVKDTMLRFHSEQIIPQAAWDRMAQYQIELSPLRVEEARDVLVKRLEDFFKPFEALDELGSWRKSDVLFPLGRPWWEQTLGAALQVRAREVIKLARERWDAQQDALELHGEEPWIRHVDAIGPVTVKPPRSLEECLDDVVSTEIDAQVAQRKLAPDSLPADADNLATLTQVLLTACEGRDEYSLVRFTRHGDKPRKSEPGYHLTVIEERPNAGEVTTGVRFATERDGRTVTAALKRLREAPDGDSVVLAGDERRPLKLAKVGKQLYTDLASRGGQGFRHVTLTFAQVAELDAMVGVLRQARVGDIEVEHPRGERRPITELEAAESLHRLDRFRSHPLLVLLLTEDPAPEPLVSSGHPMAHDDVRLGIQAYLSWRIGATAREVTTKLADDRQLGERFDALLIQVIDVADAMHLEGVLKATPQHNERFLSWLGEAS